jgi:hypothetical protein
MADYAGSVDLEKWKRNNVFHEIETVGLSPDEFLWDNAAEPLLIHKPTRSYFIFTTVYHKNPLAYLAGDGLREERTVTSWHAQIQHVGTWLRAVKSYYEMPDLWAELRNGGSMLGEGAALEATFENTPFTPGEQLEIAKQLRGISDYIKRTYPLSGAELLALDQRITYLEKAAGRVGRLDWRNLLLGAFLGAIVQGLLSPEVVRAALSMIFNALASLLGQVPPALLGG